MGELGLCPCAQLIKVTKKADYRDVRSTSGQIVFYESIPGWRGSKRREPLLLHPVFLFGPSGAYILLQIKVRTVKSLYD